MVRKLVCSFQCLFKLFPYSSEIPLLLHENDHLADLADFFPHLVLHEFALALHDSLDVADALVHRSESLSTLSLQLADVIAVALDLGIHLRKQLGFYVLQNATAKTDN
jgi:hypothetical protein